MDALAVVLLVVGLGLLVAGAELLVRGASALAAIGGISPLVIGLTVVAYGTSAPELAVGVQAALADRADIALGNIVGSNVFNVLGVLGACALATPLVVRQQLVRRDVPVMIGVSVLLLVLVLDGGLGRAEGLLLLAGAAAYTGWAIRTSRRESREVREQYEREFGPREDPGASPSVPAQAGLVLAGLGLLVLGGRWLVDGAVEIAEAVGVSELVIGLTVVAIGTSLPEAATSLVAVLRGERDIAVGNVVGSNIFNLLLIAGATATVAPGGIDVPDALVRFDLPVMTAVAVACLPIFFTGARISRWEGAVLVGYYAAYALYLLLDAAGHDAQPAFGGVMLLFVLPLTAITLAVLAVREWRARAA
jgi:cation:H+ antiporter